MPWLFLTVSRFQEIREFLDNIQHLKNIKQMLDSYHIFQRGNAADSEKGRLEFVTHRKPRIYSLGIFALLFPYLKTMSLQNKNSVLNHLHNKTVLSWKLFFYFTLRYLYNSFVMAKMHEKFAFTVGVQSLFSPYL